MTKKVVQLSQAEPEGNSSPKEFFFGNNNNFIIGRNKKVFENRKKYRYSSVLSRGFYNKWTKSQSTLKKMDIF